MLFFKKAITCALALLAAPSLAAITAGEMVTNIKQLTAKSQALQAPANSISIVNGPLIIIGQGPFPKIIGGFVDIISTVTIAIAQMQGSAAVTDPADAKAIADAFRTFVKVHQALLNILIGKAGLFTLVPIVGEPVAAVLRQLENIVDAVAFGIIDTVQVAAESASIESDRAALKGTIVIAIDSYDGVIPVKKRHVRDFSI